MENKYDAYIFIGSDEKQVKKLVKELENTFSPDYEKEIYFADETSAGEIISSANNLSLFGSSKILKVYNFEKHLKHFISYCLNPNPGTKLILISYKDANELTKKIKKDIGKNVYLKSVLKSKNVSSELFAALFQKEIKLTPEARQYINDNFDKIGDIDDIVEIFASIDAGEEGLTLDDVYPHVSGEENIFSFLDSVFDSNFKNSLNELERLVKGGESYISLLYRLHSYLRNIWNVKSLADKSLNKFDIAKSLSINPYVVTKCMAKCRNFNFAKMKFLFMQLHKTDIFLKSHDTSMHRIGFEKLLIDFCN